MRIQVQLQKRIEIARAELARLEAAAAVFAELEGKGNGKVRAFDKVARVLAHAPTEGNGHIPIPPGLDGWAMKGSTHARRNKIALAVIRACTRASAAPTREEVFAVMRALGYTPKAMTIARGIGVKTITRDRKDRLHLTPKGESALTAFA